MPFNERRRNARARVFFGGEILLDPELAPAQCHVRNISPDGSALVVQSGELIPDRFELFMRKTGRRHHAVVRHGKGRALGVAFVTAAAADRSWASLDALRKIPVG